jgi:hypothetical protein
VTLIARNAKQKRSERAKAVQDARYQKVKERAQKKGSASSSATAPPTGMPSSSSAAVANIQQIKTTEKILNMVPDQCQIKDGLLHIGRHNGNLSLVPSNLGEMLLQVLWLLRFGNVHRQQQTGKAGQAGTNGTMMLTMISVEILKASTRCRKANSTCTTIVDS